MTDTNRLTDEARHSLKIDVQPMNDLMSGAKTGEVRNDDRGFSVGDWVHLTCADGRVATFQIGHIQRGYGLPDGLCVLSYRREGVAVKPLEWEYHPAGEIAASTAGVAYLIDKRGTRPVVIKGFAFPQEFETAVEAKAAAQADYEARIRPCLVTPQPASRADADLLADNEQL